jgi:TolB-like protein
MVDRRGIAGRCEKYPLGGGDGYTFFAAVTRWQTRRQKRSHERGGGMSHRYTTGEFEVRPDERRVLLRGEPVVLGARAFDVLMCLIAQRERVVTKNELLEQVWPGMVVEENNLTVHVSALRKVFGAQAVATIPGRGYRFVMALDEAGGAAPAASAQPLAASPPPAAVAPVDADTSRLMLPDRPSIAVLPLDNLSGDPQQDLLIEGLSEDVITELSRFHSLFVIARNSSFSFRGQPRDVRAIAGELGVRYVLEGSFRRAGDRVRVAVQLVDALSATQLWAEKYDRAVHDLFAVQEELTRAIVAAIAPQIEAGEFQKIRSARGRDLNAYMLAMCARDTARRADREGDAQARDEALRLAHEAMAIDPGCGVALATIAFVQWQQIWAGSAASPADAAAAGLAAARRAIALDGSDHHAHLWKAMLQLFTHQHTAGLADLQRAHELNPNDALTLSLLGQYLAAEVDPVAGVRHVHDALRLSPRDPLRWSFLNSLAWAAFAAHDHAGAVDAATRALGEAPQFPPARLCRVIAQVGLGAIDAARADFEALRLLAPQMVATRLAGGDWSYANPALVQRATAFLRVAAGLDDPIQNPS